MLRKIFIFVWKKYIADSKVVKITGWRSVILDQSNGQRVRAWFVPRWMWWEK